MKSDNIFRVLAFGDVIGDSGRRALFSILYKMKNRLTPDLVVLNGENAAHGFGITQPVVREFLEGGVDVITSGNHVWQKKEVFEFIDKYPGLLRPLNYPPKTPGHGTYIYEKNGLKAAVINIIGRIFMEAVDCPFRAVEAEIERLKKEGVTVILVDFHAEATSEKEVFGWMFDGRISAVWGTHTHVQTSDERILPKKTAYITDLGLCGSVDSVIGMKIADSVRKVVNHLPVRFSPEEGGAFEVQGAVIDIDKKTGEAVLISRIKERVN